MGQPLAAHSRGDGNGGLGLADGREVSGQIVAVIVIRLDEHCRADRVTIADIRNDFRPQIGHAVLDPQVVVRVDDRQARIEHFFDMA